MLKNMKLTPKLTLLFLIFGLAPMLTLGLIAYSSTEKIADDRTSGLEARAGELARVIDRNLFERYGDVQAFTLNRVIFDRSSWYNPEPASNTIAQVMDQYMPCYGVYYLTILVDLEGRVIAVNSRDAAGRPIDTRSVYQKNYRNTPWFRAVSTGQFTTSMPYSAPGNDIATGTFIEDVHVDQDVKAAYPGDDGLALGFSAPVYQDGKVVAYWSNRTKFSLVEDIVKTTGEALKEAGYPSREITLLNGRGEIIVDYDPEAQGSEAVRHDFGALMRFNLADKMELAREAVEGKSGHGWATHMRKQVEQGVGYTHLAGALGYPGMNWATLIRVDKQELVADVTSTQQMILLCSVACLALILGAGVGAGRVGTKPLKQMAERVHHFAEGDHHVRLQVSSRDEIGQLGETLNEMMDQVVKGQEEVQAALREATVKAAVVENTPVNIIIADQKFNITYINPQSLKTFQGIASALPCRAEEIVGKNIDVFHKNPAHQRRILADPRNLPHRAQIQLGPHVLDLQASAIYD
jgi:HAMP domain-containing protein